MGKVMRHTLGASLNIRHNLSSSKGPKPLQLKLLTTYIPKTSAFTLAFSTSQRLRTTRATDALDEEKWLNMLGTFVKDWFRYESHFVHGRDSLVDILKERGLLSESDAVQPLIGKKS